MTNERLAALLKRMDIFHSLGQPIPNWLQKHLDEFPIILSADKAISFKNTSLVIG